MQHTRSEGLFKRAKAVIPGGVNSPVRAFGAVGGTPRFIARSKGQYLYDVDGNCYIDYIGSWGPMILGHQDERVVEAVKKQMEKGFSYGAVTALEVEMAELITSLVPAVQMVRMVNSGTEAVMSAIRVARGFTGKDKVIKFAGCYHGHGDAMLAKSGSGVMTAGLPDSPGVPLGCTRDTLIAVYNDLASVSQLLDANQNEVACIIVEPVAANMGVVLPQKGFLEGLRKLCDQQGVLLIFDEVITGFRLGLTGASGYFGVRPDLITYGKIIGGGMPVGAYGGREEIMKWVAPEGPVYQAGTLSGNPIAMRAGLTQLMILKENAAIYKRIDGLGQRLRTGMAELIEKYQLPCSVSGISSLACLFFTSQEVIDDVSAKASDTVAFGKYFNSMLDAGNYFGPSQFEAIFISAAHTKENIEKTLEDMANYFKIVAS